MRWRPRPRSWGWATEVNRFTVVYDACVLYPAPLRDLLNAHVRDALVDGHQPLIQALQLPDPDDRHVLAAAIRCGADLIITFNLDDFPEDTLASHGLGAYHPDPFLIDQLHLDAVRVCTAMRQHRASLKNPPKTVEEYLATLEEKGLTRFVQAVRP